MLPDLFDLSATVRKLRATLGETQPQFASRLGVAVVTLARWETSRPPRGAWLDKLADLAESRGMLDYAETFRGAKGNEKRGPGRPPKAIREKEPEYRDERERRFNIALRRVLRNPEPYAKELKMIEKALARPLKDMDEMLLTAQSQADAAHAIVRMHDEGRSYDEISPYFGLTPEQVEYIIAHIRFQRMKEAYEESNQPGGVK